MSNQKKISPCDYCANPSNDSRRGDQGGICTERCCIEYSRWINNGSAPKEVVETVEDFHYDRW